MAEVKISVKNKKTGKSVGYTGKARSSGGKAWVTDMGKNPDRVTKQQIKSGNMASKKKK